jgi:hypothetical protein
VLGGPLACLLVFMGPLLRNFTSHGPSTSAVTAPFRKLIVCRRSSVGFELAAIKHSAQPGAKLAQCLMAGRSSGLSLSRHEHRWLPHKSTYRETKITGPLVLFAVTSAARVAYVSTWQHDGDSDRRIRPLTEEP